MVKITKERSYLPGYVLVEVDLTGDVRGRLRNVPNVLGWLGGTLDKAPTPLRPAEVNRILGSVDEMQKWEWKWLFLISKAKTSK